MKNVLLFGLSATALVALIAGTAYGLDARRLLGGAETALATEPITAEPVDDAPAPSAAADPTLDLAEPDEAAPAGAADAELAPQVLVPDLGRQRVDRAAERLHELGLELHAVGDYREDIDPRSEGRYYGIRPGSITPAPGTLVEPGTHVEVRTYELSGGGGGLFAAGY